MKYVLPPATVLKLLTVPITDKERLHEWIRVYLHVDIPRERVCECHDAPFDYVWRAYREPAQDMVVWAPRGGGKTRVAAVATMLDLLHKPGTSVRVLGGSLAQSFRIWEHLLADVEKTKAPLRERRLPGQHRLALECGSDVAAIPQSQRAVRGLHVQKMRCDEVEMFDGGVWDAAQLVTKSLTLPDGRTVRGAIEALSTHHKPWGLMRRIIEDAEQRKVRVIKWCILEVLETCPPERVCQTCDLFEDCGGVAKEKCRGFFSIDDAITLKRRTSKDMWDAEMLCRRPNVSGSVFPHFDEAAHVTPAPDPARAAGPVQLALDFGFANPFVCLWVLVRDDGAVHVVDEYVQSGRTVHEHLEQIEARPWGRATHVACDPAGAARSDQTAESNVALLRARGYKVRTRHSLIQDGLEMIRAALKPAAGPTKLFIDPKCTRLVKAMRAYHYPENGGEVPVKDGEHDHLVDALRYWFVNRPTELPPPRRY